MIRLVPASPAGVLLPGPNNVTTMRHSRRLFMQGLAATSLSALLGGCGSDPFESAGGAAQQAPTLQQKIAQMMMVGFRGTTLEEGNPIARDIASYGVGGVILFDYDVMEKHFGRNITGPAQLQALTASLRKLASTPLLVAVDQEGGRVARLKPSCGFPATVSAQSLGDANNLWQTRWYADSIAATLADNGFNLDFAPVVDLNINPKSPAIGALGRSFSADPAIVEAHAGEFVKAMDAVSVLSCLKHFPGHGSASADSHQGFVDVTNTWSSVELEPYRALMSQGLCRMIMTAHIFNGNLDPDYPATLSAPTITGLLRNTLGYQGVVITDDMQMGAITQHFSYNVAVQKAIEAGVDIILVANNSSFDPDVVPRTIELVTGLVENGFIPESRIDQSYQRIMAGKTLLL